MSALNAQERLLFREMGEFLLHQVTYHQWDGRLQNELAYRYKALAALGSASEEKPE